LSATSTLPGDVEVLGDGVEPGADVPDGAAEPRVPTGREPSFGLVLGEPDGEVPKGPAPGALDDEGAGEDAACRGVPCPQAVAATRTASAARTGRERVTWGFFRFRRA
jgi:hypothetical protein